MRKAAVIPSLALILMVAGCYRVCVTLFDTVDKTERPNPIPPLVDRWLLSGFTDSSFQFMI